MTPIDERMRDLADRAAGQCEAQWLLYPCQVTREPDGTFTLSNLEPGYEYLAEGRMFMGYSLVRVWRRALAALDEHDAALDEDAHHG